MAHYRSLQSHIIVSNAYWTHYRDFLRWIFVVSHPVHLSFKWHNNPWKYADFHFQSFITNEPALFEFKSRPDDIFEEIIYIDESVNIHGFLRCSTCHQIVSKRIKNEHKGEHTGRVANPH